MVYLLLVSTTSIYSSDITIPFNPFSHLFPLYLLMLIISPTPMIQHFIKFDRNMHFMDGMHQNQDTVCPFEGDTSNVLHRQGKHYF